MAEIFTISSYLQKTKLLNVLQSLITTETDKLLYLASSQVEHKELEKEKILFRIGDQASKFYIVLSGRLGVYKPIASIQKMKIIDYISLLDGLYIKIEYYLLEKIFKANFKILEIKNLLEFEKIKKFIFKRTLKNLLKETRKSEEIFELFKLNNYNLEEFNLDKAKFIDLEEKYKVHMKKVKTIKSERSINNFEDIVFDDWECYCKSILEFNVHESELERNINFNIEYEFEIQIYSLFMYLYPGHYFGDFALDNIKDNKRTATIKVEETANLGVFNKHIYQNFIFNEKQKIKLKEVNFFHSNFFFNSLRQEYFESKIFNHISPHEYSSKYILFKEGEPIKYIYFVREGSVEISITSSIINLQKQIENLLSNNQNVKKLSNYSILVNSYMEGILNNINSKLLKEKLSEKKKFNLFKIAENNIIGLEDLLLSENETYITKGLICSSKAKIYKLSIEKLNSLFKTEKSIETSFYNLAYSKISPLITRIYNLKEYTINEIQKHENEAYLNKRKSIISKQQKENNFKFSSLNIYVLETSRNRLASSDTLRPKSQSKTTLLPDNFKHKKLIINNNSENSNYVTQIKMFKKQINHFRSTSCTSMIEINKKEEKVIKEDKYIKKLSPINSKSNKLNKSCEKSFIANKEADNFIITNGTILNQIKQDNNNYLNRANLKNSKTEKKTLKLTSNKSILNYNFKSSNMLKLEAFRRTQKLEETLNKNKGNIQDTNQINSECLLYNKIKNQTMKLNKIVHKRQCSSIY